MSAPVRLQGRATVADDDYTRLRENLMVTEESPRNTASADGAVCDWGDYSQPVAGTPGVDGQPNNTEHGSPHLARVQLEARRCASFAHA
ncbi:hypothetical protein KDX01_00885 [Burkholderia vietnamiensis]|uniref:hypothetical protein n=1 Tax=Burkholderia vietnamiensis TaxID=60552 RepID=UPI001BA2CE34|nr:hypothetical protein [Burkholderia vietnamiensis]MBR7971669.1 hypothetical protein [Burkholderia vietnamiensis]